jgi:hypothetical protein
MDYLTLLQRPILEVKYDQASRSLKTASGGALDDFWYTDPNAKDASDPATLFRSVAWLNRAIEMRANAVASMPFLLYRGETEVDTSKIWKNTTGVLPQPYRMLWLIEAALCFGPAYIWRERNRVKTTGLRYVVPSTITPKIDETLGLVGFTRQVGVKRMEVAAQDLLYFWKPDPFVELGPPLTTPAGAALAAAGVLYNLDQFAAAFWARGAIKATMLTVEGNPSPEAKSDLKKWWQRAVSGVNNSFAANVISASVKPVVVGEGLESLSDSALVAKQREDISTALGIPQTLLFSTGAGGLGGGGVVQQDEAHFYSKTVVPECGFIAGVLNEQLWQPLGLRMEFKPETLDVFQADENERAAAFGVYVTAGLPVELVGEMLGLELPDGWTWERIAAEKAKRAAAVAEQMAPKEDEDEDEDEDDQPAPTLFDAKAVLDDLRAWRRKSVKRGRLADFESDAIPDATMTAIRSSGDWLAALDAAIKSTVMPVQSAGVDDLVKALRDATAALGASDEHG